MKKIFSAVLCLLLIISLFSCDTGGDESSAPSGSGSSLPSDTPVPDVSDESSAPSGSGSSLPSDTSGTGEPVNL